MVVHCSFAVQVVVDELKHKHRTPVGGDGDSNIIHPPL
jgi:hypothetical protein